MKLIPVDYYKFHPGEEVSLRRKIKKAKAPFIISIQDFPDTFDINFFKQRHQPPTASYSLFNNGYWVKNGIDSFQNIIDKIIADEPYRIFSEIMPEAINQEVLKAVPFLDALPHRPKYFNHRTQLPFFFGGKGGVTPIHYDREKVELLHLCLSGEKRFYLFLEDQNKNLYKEPFIGDSGIPFREPFEELIPKYPDLNNATCYQADLKGGDMLYMPKNCWHYTVYKSPSAATCFSIYPYMINQLLGCFSGYFFLGYHELTNIRFNPIIAKYRHHYCYGSGLKKLLLRGLETPLYLAIAAPLIPYTYYLLRTGKGNRLYSKNTRDIS